MSDPQIPARPPAGSPPREHPTATRPVLAAARNPGTWLLASTCAVWILVLPDYLVFTLTAAIPVAVVGLGLLVLQGWARDISLAAAGLFATSMYYFNWFDRDVEGLALPWPLAAAGAIAVPTVLMAALAAVSGRLPGVYLIILTLGLQIVLEKTVFQQGYLSGGLSGGNGGLPLANPRPTPFGIDLRGDAAFCLFSIFWLLAVLVGLARLRHSPTGLAIMLVGADRQAAAAVGACPLRLRILAFTVAGMLAGIGGVLGSLLFINPPVFIAYRLPDSLILLAIPVLAGVDSIIWVVITAAWLEITPILLETFDQTYIAVAGLGLGALVGARGLGGRASDLYRRYTHGNRRARTRRRAPAATAALRTADGITGPGPGTLSEQARLEALALLRAWLPPATEHTLAVRVAGVELTFGAVRALDGITLEVPAGCMVGLIGPNGAGKTTLFDVISGFQPPDAGRVELFGADVTTQPAWNRARLGMARTFQSSRVMTELTVADNIVAGAYRRVRSRPLGFLLGLRGPWAELRRAEQAALAAARLLDIDRYWDEHLSTVEFSVRRRVEIARALLAGPRLLLLDEPAAGLDPTSCAALFDLVRALQRDLGLTVLLVEHYVKAVLDTCDLVHVIACGDLLATGTPAEVAADPQVRERYLGHRLDYLRPAP